MASYNELLALIDAYINQNGVQAITGQVLNGVLRAMVDQLGRGYSIMGAADPTTDPGTPDGPESWFASVPGTYTNFDGIQIADGELAMLSYTPSDGFAKNTLYDGFQEVTAQIDGNVGTPAVGVSYANGILSFDFHNMKGETGDPAGFGSVSATIDDNIGTPSVSVAASGPDTARNFAFNFRNLKGETGVTSVLATVDNTSGNPQCAVSLQGQQLTLAFTGLKGAQGDTGSSVDYPFTIVNNLTTNDATQALSAAMGVQLESEVSQLEAEVSGDLIVTKTGGEGFASFTALSQDTPVIIEIVGDVSNIDNIKFLQNWSTQKSVYVNGRNVFEETIPATCNRFGIYAKAGQTFDVTVTIRTSNLSGEIKVLTSNLANAVEGINAVNEKCSDITGVIRKESSEAYYVGTVLYVKEYAPEVGISAETNINVTSYNSNVSSVSMAITRNGSTVYLSLIKTGDKYNGTLLAGDIVKNIFAEGGSAGDIFDILFWEQGDNLKTEISNISDEIGNISDEIGDYSDETKTAFLEGTVVFVVKYNPTKKIVRETSLIVELISSVASGVSVTISRGGVTNYISLTNNGGGVFSTTLQAGDEVKNIFADNQTSMAGDTFAIIYDSGGIESEISRIKETVFRSGYKWMAIGDSLTDFATLGSSVSNYVNYVAKRLGLTAINKGVGGTGYWKGHTSNIAFYQRVLTYSEDADIITIFGSLNDLGTEDGVVGQQIIGNISDNTTDTLCGCINKTLDNLGQQYPNALIGIVSPTPWSNSHDSTYPEQYVTKMKQICEYRSIPFLDLYHGSTLRPWDESFRSSFFRTSSDGAHPNTYGHKRFSGFFSAFIEGILYTAKI